MGSGKIEFRIGGIDFCGEGEEKWVASQLDKILEKAPDLLEIAPTNGGENDNGGDSGNDSGGGAPAGQSTKLSLPNFLKTKNAKSQVERFLATAEWITLRGTKMLTTKDVTSALKDSHQSRLGNPADCLNQNVKKGHCEKDGKSFFVTPDGRKSVG